MGRPEDGFGAPFILMQCIEGGHFADRFPKSPREDLGPLQAFAALFRCLHTFDWRPYSTDADQIDLPGNPYFHFDQRLKLFSGYLASAGLTVFDPVLDWLKAQRARVPCHKSSVVHFDFHADNILEDADGQLYVVDWSSAGISDYRFDLGWSLALALAYGGAVRREMILDAYQRQVGRPVPELAVFEVAAFLQRIALVMISLAVGAEKLGMRPAASEAMRRDREPLTRLYQRMVLLTGLTVPEVAAWLDSLG